MRAKIAVHGWISGLMRITKIGSGSRMYSMRRARFICSSGIVPPKLGFPLLLAIVGSLSIQIEEMAMKRNMPSDKSTELFIVERRRRRCRHHLILHKSNIKWCRNWRRHNCHPILYDPCRFGEWRWPMNFVLGPDQSSIIIINSISVGST